MNSHSSAMAGPARARQRQRAADYTFGAVPQDDGTVRFRLWAPGIAQVSLEIEGGRIEAMQAGADGFHEVQCACPMGTRYRYRISPDLSVPDPASRRQDGDVANASVVVDADTYDWRNGEWRGRPWSETVLYEIHAGLAGGFRGVQERLADLAELGITAIELMPIADFPGTRNWGYDAVLPYAPDCAYGTPDELRLLIDTAHGMGLMVFLDVVYNHFGPSGNYLGAYAPEFFRSDLPTPWGQAIDFRKKQVRAFFAENALYWLQEYRFDGLRLDAVHAIADPGWLAEMAQFVRDRVGPDRHVHLVLENDDNAAGLMHKGFDAQWNDDAHHVLHHMLTGESQGYYAAYADDPTARLARCLAEGFAYQGEPSLWRHGEPRGEPSAGLPPSSFVFFLQNHDQIGNRAFGERLVSLCESNIPALQAAIVLQILTPHIPLLFMGEEYGSAEPFLFFTSFKEDDLARAVREGRRMEFAAFGEFSDPAARERIPDPNALQTWETSKIRVDSQDPQAKRWRAWYGRLLRTRSQFVMPHLCGTRSVSVQIIAPFCLVARWRLGNGDLLSIYCNLSGQAVALPGGLGGADEITIFDSCGLADQMAPLSASLPAHRSIATRAPASGTQTRQRPVKERS
jgi:maltooligosyltrehalose trehalohydrolase